jgi:signal transduction histidine kinase
LNVAKGKPVVTDINKKFPDRRIDALTDGLNFYGQILPLRDWLNELARRHDLEVERGIVASVLARKYTEKVAMLRRMSWLAAALGTGLVFTFLINRMLQIRQLAKVRERFAADLHDELGATLHSIGLLSDIAQRADDNPEELKRIHSRIRELADRTGKVIRNFADVMQTEGLYKDIREDMERASRRILSRLDNDISVQGIEHIQRLKQQTRIDLFLFFQECLVNISRHSGATRFTTRLEANRREVSMTIQDNGRGLGEAHSTTPPPSLLRRARLLGGRITVDNPADGGTRIRLSLTTRRLGLFK